MTRDINLTITSHDPIAEICFDFWQNFTYEPDHIHIRINEYEEHMLIKLHGIPKGKSNVFSY